MEFYAKETGEVNNFLALALSSRKNLCIHPEVKTLKAEGFRAFWKCWSNRKLLRPSGELSALWEGGRREVPQPDCVLHPGSAPQQPRPARLPLLRGRKSPQLTGNRTAWTSTWLKLCECWVCVSGVWCRRSAGSPSCRHLQPGRPEGLWQTKRLVSLLPGSVFGM